MKRLLLVLCVLSIAISCSGKDETESGDPTAAAADPRERYKVESTTIVVDDQPVEIAVEKIDPEDFPFFMYVPSGTDADTACTDSHCELALRLPEAAAGGPGVSLHFFALQDLVSSEEDEPAVTGAGGLFEKRGWRATREITEGADLVSPTVRKRIDFESVDGSAGGFVLFADVDSRVVRIVAIAPAGNPRLQGLAGIPATTLVRSNAI